MESSTHHGVRHTFTFIKNLKLIIQIKLLKCATFHAFICQARNKLHISVFLIITSHAIIFCRTPPSTRYGAAGGVYPGSTLLYVSLGFAGERFFDTFILDTSTNQWSTSKSYNPCPVLNKYYTTAQESEWHIVKIQQK